MSGSFKGQRRLRCLLLLAAPALTVAQEPRPEVGEEPETHGQQVMALDERNLLTPAGEWVLESSVSYVHSSSLDVAIEGFTILPAVAVGLIDVSETYRDTSTFALALKRGITDRFEVGIKVPYTHREQQVRRRDILQETTLDQITESQGDGLGDIEFSAHYQFNVADRGWPFLTGNLQVKGRNGKNPFEVDRRELVVDGERVGTVFAEQPTGSGFRAVQPSLSVSYPTDPAAIFGNISYIWNIERDVSPEYGRIDPGNVFGISFGSGISLNNRTSMSFSYSHSVVYPTKSDNTNTEADFSRVQVGSLSWGVAHRISKDLYPSFSVAVGATQSAPDIQLMLRLPTRF